MMTPSKLDPMVGIGSGDGIISDCSDNADLLDFCFLCSRQFFHENLDNYGTERYKDEDILESFFEELGPVERSLLQCCPSCRKLCKTVTRTKEALSSLIEEITSLLLRTRKVSYLVSKSRVVSRLFQSSNSSLPPCETSTSYLQRPLSQINFVRDVSIPSTASTNPSYGSIPSEFDLRIDSNSLNVADSFCLGLPNSSSAVSVIKKSPLCKFNKDLESPADVRITRSATSFASIFNESIMNSVSDNACDILAVGPRADPSNCSAATLVGDVEKCSYILSNNLEDLQERPQIIQSVFHENKNNTSAIQAISSLLPFPDNIEKNQMISQPELLNSFGNYAAANELHGLGIHVPLANKRKSARTSFKTLDSHNTKLKTRNKISHSLQTSQVSPIPSLNGTNKVKVNYRKRTNRKIISKKPTHFQCNICSKLLRSARNLRDHLTIHKNETFLCEICGVGYRRKSGLESHIAMHAGETKFRCNICFKFFTQKTGLERHSRIHSNKFQYQCEVCGKNFLHHSSFNSHKISHEGVKNFACTECDLTFLQSSHLQRHMIVHTGAKPYRCNMCNRSFSQRFNMKVHMQTHDQVPSIVFDCPKCPKSFTRKFKLKVHMEKFHDTKLC